MQTKNFKTGSLQTCISQTWKNKGWTFVFNIPSIREKPHSRIGTFLKPASTIWVSISFSLNNYSVKIPSILKAILCWPFLRNLVFLRSRWGRGTIKSTEEGKIENRFWEGWGICFRRSWDQYHGRGIVPRCNRCLRLRPLQNFLQNSVPRYWSSRLTHSMCDGQPGSSL